MSADDWKAELKAEVQAELDSKFAHLTHYSRSTYAAGCRGPMCRKAERDETKRRQELKERVSGMPYRPQVDDVETCLRDDLLNQMIFTHRASRNKPLIPRRPVYPPGWFGEEAG